MSAIGQLRMKAMRGECSFLEIALVTYGDKDNDGANVAAEELADLTTKLDLSQKENCDLRRKIQAAEEMASRLRALREFVGEMELRGETDVLGCKLWDSADEAALTQYEELQK